MVAMIFAGTVGNWVGQAALNHLPERRFRLILRVVLSALALRLVYTAVRGAGWV